jgi:protein arginine phosphatase
MNIYNKIIREMNDLSGVHLHYTGSIFGVGCSVFDEESIDDIREFKGKPKSTGFVVLIPEFEWLKKYKINVPSEMMRIFQQYWPGNLTVILPDTENSFGKVAEDGNVAFRVPQDELLRDFIKQTGSPIISTSVNLSGRHSETDLKTIENKFGIWFDFAIVPKNISWSRGVPSTIMKFDKELELIRESTIKFSQIKRSFKTSRILFVCTANICRSPMADCYLKKLVAENGLNFDVKSAGFLESNHPISENSRLTLQENGIDASAHVSTKMNEEVIYGSWLILTMTESHKNGVIDRYPNAALKTYTISEFSGLKKDIGDPYGMGMKEYRETYKLIKQRCDLIFDKLTKEEE